VPPLEESDAGSEGSEVERREWEEEQEAEELGTRGGELPLFHGIRRR